jgi:hypothetical protein
MKMKKLTVTYAACFLAGIGVGVYLIGNASDGVNSEPLSDLM